MRIQLLRLTAAAALFLSALPAFAQSASATLKLTVVDPTGAVLAGADVTIVASDSGKRGEEGSADRC